MFGSHVSSVQTLPSSHTHRPSEPEFVLPAASVGTVLHTPSPWEASKPETCSIVPGVVSVLTPSIRTSNSSVQKSSVSAGTSIGELGVNTT